MARLDVKESHDSRKSGHPRFGHRASGEKWSVEESDAHLKAEFAVPVSHLGGEV